MYYHCSESACIHNLTIEILPLLAESGKNIYNIITVDIIIYPMHCQLECILLCTNTLENTSVMKEYNPSD